MTTAAALKPQALFPCILALPSGQRLSIAKACPEEAEEVLAYLNHVAGESDFLNFGRNEYPLSLEEKRRHLAKYANHPRGVVLTGRVDGVLASVTSIEPYLRSRNCHRGLLSVNVLQAFWGQGVGRAMMEAVLRWAREESTLAKIELTVMVHNHKAQALYESLGFEKEGVIKGSLCLNGEYVDDYRMSLWVGN